MTTRKPLTEGNMRNIQKGNVAKPNVRPIAPPPAPTPPSSEPNTNNGGIAAFCDIELNIKWGGMLIVW